MKMGAEGGDEKGKASLQSDFLDRVAHELRGPAGVTMGALDELELALAGQLDGQAPLFAMARRGLKKVLRTAERLTHTAQLESGRLKLTPASTDLTTLVRQATSDAEMIEGRRGVRVETQFPGAAVMAQVDSAWLRVALAELLSQALRCARQVVTVSLSKDERGLRINIADDGPVVRTPGDDCSSAAPSERPYRRDSGFSLYLAGEIVRTHGGELKWEVIEPNGLSAIISFEAS